MKKVLVTAVIIIAAVASNSAAAGRFECAGTFTHAYSEGVIKSRVGRLYKFRIETGDSPRYANYIDQRYVKRPSNHGFRIGWGPWHPLERLKLSTGADVYQSTVSEQPDAGPVSRRLTTFALDETSGNLVAMQIIPFPSTPLGAGPLFGVFKCRPY